MSKPFDFIDGKKVDLNNQLHRDIIIQRNKKLQKGIDEGIYIFDSKDLKIKIIARVEIDCLVCGSHVEEDEDNDIDDAYNKFADNLLPKSFKCVTCKSSYHFDSKEDSYYVRPHKENLKRKTK